jgi:hypothetical protein
MTAIGVQHRSESAFTFGRNRRSEWAGIRTSGAIDAFVTMDTNLQHQQNVSVLPFRVVVVLARSNRMQDLAPLVPEILDALGRVRPGTVEQAGRVRKRRDRMK